MLKGRADPSHPPTVEEMADTAHELAEIAHAVASMPHPPEGTALDAVQLRLVKATATVVSWAAPTTASSPPATTTDASS